MAKLLERLNPKVLEVGVDYLTVSCMEPKQYESFSAAGQEILFKEKEFGHKIKPHRRNNYDGFAAGSAFVGRRDDGFMCEVSGATAHAHWKLLTPFQTNCSRIDTQVTIRVEDEAYDLQRLIWLQCKRWVDRTNAKLKVRHTQEHDSGHTVYLGKPKSVQMARAYNKWHESKDEYYRGCHRYEVQYRDRAANERLRQLSTSARPELTIGGNVHLHFASRGHTPLWSASTGTAILSPRKLHPLDQRLLWLTRAGKKLAEELMEVGRFDELLSGWQVPAEVLLAAAARAQAKGNETTEV